jgi:hypothetical protein
VSVPLLFVCRHLPEATGELDDSTEFIALKSPHGPVLQAFESHELANAILTFHGSAENVFLLTESALTPSLIARLAGQSIVIFRTNADYRGATGGEATFPWADRVIRYDPRSAVLRGVTDA